MKKDELLYDYIKSRGMITCSELEELGYPRIYLTILVKQNKIFKISRGVYSINKDDSLNPLYEFQKNNKKAIYSCYTALNILGFYDYKPSNIQISVPQGYNATRYLKKDVFYNNDESYGIGVVYNEDKQVYVYDLERSVCDIIKEKNRFDIHAYNKFINYYFNRQDINYSKLLEYSKLLKVSKKVQEYLSLFKA